MQVRATLSLLSASLLPLAATGCAFNTATIPNPQSTPATISGHTFGGQQPVAGAAIYMVQVTNDGKPATILNGSGAVTDASGSFSVTGTYKCTPGQPVYVLARGGNPGLAAGTNNAGIALMAALGNCPSNGNDLASTVPSVVINEVTTVAAVYALAPFMSGPTTVSTAGSVNGAAGLPAAFATAANLVDITNGAARSITPAGNGVVPVRTINTLADILATCINSDGSMLQGGLNARTGQLDPTSTCYTLYNSAPDRTGRVPADTITALVNIAHSPGSHDLPGGGWTTAGLYSLLTTQAPFQPTIPQLPIDFTLEVAYSGGGLSGAQTLPRSVAVDASGNVWTINQSAKTVSLFSNVGAPLSAASGFSGITAGTSSAPFASPVAIAINGSGNAVVVDSGANGDAGSLRILTPSGNVQTLVDGLQSPTDVAVNGTGQMYFVPSHQLNGVYAINPGGTQPIQLLSGNGLSTPRSVAVDNLFGQLAVVNQDTNTDSVARSISPYRSVAAYSTGSTGQQFLNATDSKGNVWTTFRSATQTSSSGVLKQNHAGVPAQGSPFTAVYTLSFPNSIAIDGADNAFIASSETVPMFQLDSDGHAVSGYSGYVSDVVPTSVAIDASGNVWFRNANDATLRELIGLAASTMTPLCSQNL